MKKTLKFVIAMVLALTTASFMYSYAKADDDEKYEHHEGKHEDDNDEEEDGEDYEYNHDNIDSRVRINSSEPIESWSKWSRSAMIPFSYEQLPFSKQSNVKLRKDNQTINIDVYPYKGELYVPIKETAELLGADVATYDSIHAAELLYQQKQLIFRLGSRAVYENGLKTPMSNPTLAYNSHLYVPVSVIANGLGFIVKWNPQEGLVINSN